MEGLWFMLFEWAIERRAMVADVSSYNVCVEWDEELEEFGIEYDLDCLKQMMWALEYDPDLYTRNLIQADPKVLKENENHLANVANMKGNI
ncbi:hypothetical protein Hdeb2414_s0013g00415281 [Helianthus debilis subsp. tardiflorus]